MGLAAFSIDPERLVAASITVFITTLQDAIWLPPLVKPDQPTLAITHALAFVLTFTLLSLTVGTITLFITRSMVENLQTQDVVMSGAGACLCWVVAAVLFYKDWQKQREISESRRPQPPKLHDEENGLLGDPESKSSRENNNSGKLGNYGATSTTVDCDSPDVNGESSNVEDTRQFQIWLVITLTVIGAIDEVSYFPGLIAGGIFSVAELTLGTTIASFFILLIVCVFLAPCRPVLDFLDRVPLYCVVSVFAILLTVEAIWLALT
jgi:hypothetical protein